tara:strand:+ start:1303 stop:1917 length:615 start_codon:yes stop_codon:yes gene_type:complete
MKSFVHHQYVLINSKTAKYRIILLHGWGADADDLLPIGQEITKGVNDDFDIISLRAPNPKPDNIGRQWYGLYPANWSEAEQEVNKLISTLTEIGNKGIPLSNSILFGFSQGAAMSIAAGAGLNLGLIVSCSGYPHPNWDKKINSPILLSHGTKDGVVPISATRQLYEDIKQNSKYVCKFHEFDGFHEIDSTFIDFLRSEINYIF